LDFNFITYFLTFKLKVLAYMCINHNGDGADLKLPKFVASEAVREYFPTGSWKLRGFHYWSWVGIHRVS